MGLQKGDVILKVNGIAIENLDGFDAAITRGKVKSFSVWRNQGNVELKK